MKNLLRAFRTLFLALLPFVTSITFTVSAGGVISMHFPALGPLLYDWPALLATGLYWLELLVRVVPTTTDYSPVNFLLQLLQALVPNRAVSISGHAGDFVNLSRYRVNPSAYVHPPAISPAYVSGNQSAAAAAGGVFPLA